MITKAEKILKELGLDYKPLIKDKAFVISPLDFMCNIKIVLVNEQPNGYSMFIWKDWDVQAIQKECKFDEPGNITDIYSYLYNYDKNNLATKKQL